VTVTQCLGVLNLVLDAAAQASSLERFSHHDPLGLALNDR
jgi:hypothetical protein